MVQILKEANLNGDGTIDYEDFLSLMWSQSHAPQIEKAASTLERRRSLSASITLKSVSRRTSNAPVHAGATPTAAAVASQVPALAQAQIQAALTGSARLKSAPTNMLMVMFPTPPTAATVQKMDHKDTKTAPPAAHLQPVAENRTYSSAAASAGASTSVAASMNANRNTPNSPPNAKILKPSARQMS